MDRKLNLVKTIAKQIGLPNWFTLDESKVKNKRFSVISPSGKLINFGLFPYKKYGAYIDHNNEKIRDAWRARHSKILKDGKPAFLNPESPEFYSWHLLW